MSKPQLSPASPIGRVVADLDRVRAPLRASDGLASRSCPSRRHARSRARSDS
ncbi:hypothetical protein [Agromyces sp. Leaf222]|uniref:hypothetical protein n=1 Tax=Agromyces sp. Leaf222 TaxID=1735688 RepID=UPI0012FBBAA2|nr:hypothetical protein [Agromyces sp. Leaf222]